MQGMQEIWVKSLGREDPLEEEMATHSSILAWICTEDSGGLQSLATQSWTRLRIHTDIKWHNSPSLSHLTHHLRPLILSPLPTLLQFSSSVLFFFSSFLATAFFYLLLSSSHCFPFPPLPLVLHLAGRMSLVKYLPHHTTAFSDFPLFLGLEMKVLIGLQGPHRDDHCAPHPPQLQPVPHMFSQSGHLQTCGHPRPMVSQGLEQQLPQPRVLFPLLTLLICQILAQQSCLREPFMGTVPPLV